MGSPAIAALFAHVAFWVLLVYGWAADALELPHAVVFVALWMAGAFGFPRLPWLPARAMFPSFVAALDIALVFAIFKGDVRIS